MEGFWPTDFKQSKPVKTLLPSFRLDDWLFNENRRLYIPMQARSKFLELAHESPIEGRFVLYSSRSPSIVI